MGWGAVQQAAREAEQVADQSAGLLLGQVHDDLAFLPAVPRSSLLAFLGSPTPPWAPAPSCPVPPPDEGREAAQGGVLRGREQGMIEAVLAAQFRRRALSGE